MTNSTRVSSYLRPLWSEKLQFNWKIDNVNTVRRCTKDFPCTKLTRTLKTTLWHNFLKLLQSFSCLFKRFKRRFVTRLHFVSFSLSSCEEALFVRLLLTFEVFGTNLRRGISQSWQLSCTVRASRWNWVCQFFLLKASEFFVGFERSDCLEIA